MKTAKKTKKKIPTSHRGPGRPKKPQALKSHVAEKIEKKKPGRPKKIQAEAPKSQPRAPKPNSGIVAIKKFCKDHHVTYRMFLAEVQRRKLPCIAVRGESTHNQVAKGIAEQEAEKILKQLKESLEPVGKDEITLHEMAEALKVSLAAIRERIRVRKIKGRKGRYPAKCKNRHLRNQHTVIYKKADLHKIQTLLIKPAKNEKKKVEDSNVLHIA